MITFSISYLNTSPLQLVLSLLLLDYLLYFLHTASWEKWFTTKPKCNQILLVTKHKQTHQVVAMILGTKYFIQIWNISKDAWMNQWTSNEIYSTRFLKIKALLLIWTTTLSHTFLTTLHLSLRLVTGSVFFPTIFTWWSLSLVKTVELSVRMVRRRSTCRRRTGSSWSSSNMFET